MKYGFIAQNTAVNGIPTYRGYDLKLVQGKPGLTISDYELIFNTFGCERLKTLDPQKVLENIDKTYMRVYEERLDVKEEMTKAIESVEETGIELNGKVIKNIKAKGNVYTIEIAEDNAETRAIAEKIMNCWQGAREAKNKRDIEIAIEMSVGALDIHVVDGKQTLVLHGENESKVFEDKVPVELVKQTLYYYTDLYKMSKEYRNRMNCSYEESGYICSVVKGQMQWDKKDGEWTEIETAICKDLLKLKM